MDIDRIREHAQGHANAMLAGDLKRAAKDLSESGRAGAPAVMGEMPKSLESAEVTTVAEDGDEATAVIVYSGEGREVTVKSRWSEEGDRPTITELKLL